MKTFPEQINSIGKNLAWGLLFLSTAAITGCANHRKHQTEVPMAGMQKGEILSATDATRLKDVRQSVSQTHVISDADLDWTLSMLGRPQHSVGHLSAMSILSEIRPMSAAQKAKISPALLPYLNSTDKIEQVSAQRVENAMNGN